MLKIAPSILAADPLNLEADTRRLRDAGCDWFHVDVMDAHFVPNLSFGPEIVRALRRRYPEMPLDVHLMMDNPESYIDCFAEAGATGITIHAEIPGDVAEALRAIRAAGCYAGLSLKPDTPAEAAMPYLSLMDLCLIMTVEPGFGGQELRLDTLPKLRALREEGFTGLIEADGGLKLRNLPLLIERSLDVAVIGTGLFRTEDPAEKIRAMRALALPG